MKVTQLQNYMAAINYDQVKNQEIPLETLTLEELRGLLSFEMLSDGMEPEDVQEILDGDNPSYQTTEQIMNELVEIFGY